MQGVGEAPVMAAARGATVGGLFRQRALIAPGAPAVQDEHRRLDYAALARRVNRAAHLLDGLGVGRGDRIAVLSENRYEFLELLLAAALRGAILAAQNWRLADPELRHCVELVAPRALFASPRHADCLAAVAPAGVPLLRFDATYEDSLSRASDAPPPDIAAPDDPLLILYTSGTTGLPKAAVMNHRTEIARTMLRLVEYQLPREVVTATWPPLYHISGAEEALSALLVHGEVRLLAGFDPELLAGIVATEKLGWLRLMPGMVGPMIEALKRGNIRPRGVSICGTMADLVPGQQIAEITTLLDAPYVNTFGATETGYAPASAGLIPVGEVPTDLAKTQTGFCELRLVDAEDRDVAPGEPGEAAVRGPTVFSGYWNAPETNRHDFRGGWFHMGDMFRRRADGKLLYVDRVKYTIKSGGENIYPAEIERVLMADPLVAEAVVVRRPDARWGEVPVALVVRRDAALTAEALSARMRAALAGYKQPKAIYFLPLSAFPRSTTGKVQRHELERALAAGALPLDAE